jgi:alpha-tubulin suppressor-like RCC1 family protein
MSRVEITTNFRDSNGVDLGKKLITKDYLISVYPSIGQQIGIPPELWIWGRGNEYVNGNSSFVNRSTPVTTSAGGSNWKQVSVGFNHCAAIKTDGTLWTWGLNNNGQIGDNSSFTRPIPVTTFAGGTNWKQVSSGQVNTAAIKTDGTLWIWGQGFQAQLGTNNIISRSNPVTTFAGGTNWKQVSLGGNMTVAIKTDGTLWIWGTGSEGQLGNIDVTTKSTPVTTFAGGTNWKQVSAAGLGHCAAIKTDGTLWTWGTGSSGQLGRTTGDPVITPVTTFAGGTNWADTLSAEPEDLYTISAGRSNTVAIKTDGTLWTWGEGSNGNLGNNDASIKVTPVTTFAGGTNWKQLSNGVNHCTAIKTDGTLWTWGSAGNGQLGINSLFIKSTPVTTFAGGTNWKQVSANNNHCAAIKTDGTLWTWGSGSSGKLGTNDIAQRNTPVTTFAGGTDWKQVSAGSATTAAIKTDGTLWIWGTGSSGQLGNNDGTSKSTPVTTFAGGTNWKQVSSAGYMTAAIKTDGTLWTWGNALQGQLGNNATNSRLTPVTTFVGGTNWKQVSSAGGNHCAAIKTDGTMWTWGRNSEGQLGTNDINQRNTPVTTFAGGTNWKQVSTQNTHSVALLDDGVNKQLFLFGGNPVGQLGFLPSRIIPDQVFGNHTNWKQVSSGDSHSVAIKTDGTLWGWGAGSQGQLGNNQIPSRLTPVTTFAGGTNWKQVSGSGYRNTVAIKTDGTLWIWGSGVYGRLGNNTFNITSFTPITTFAGGTNWKQVSGGRNNTAVIKSVDF